MRLHHSILVGGLGLAWMVAGCDQATDSSGPGSTALAPVNGEEWFEDITQASGLDFQHIAGTNYFMPDQVGSGIALLDYDQDGRLDVYLVQNGGAEQPAPNQLFHQETDGTFRNVSQGSGLDVTGRGMGAIAGDLNNDALPEVVLTEYGAVRLFHNLGQGKFREMPPGAGVDNPRWAGPASFLDYDRDGWLDLVVGNYVDYDPSQECFDVQGRRDFCAPKAFGETVTRLWRNLSTQPGQPPQFEETTESAGLIHAPGVALGLVCADFDGDSWPDIFCADDGRPNRLFINGHDGTFREEAAPRGLAFNAMGATAADMGTAFADVDNDGMADLFVTHLTEEFHSFWKQGPRGVFMDQATSFGLQHQAWRGTGFGTVMTDFNRDGQIDLALANGLVRRAIPAQSPVPSDVSPWWSRYAQRAQLFSRNAQGKFVDISTANTAFCGQAMVGRSLASGDLDNDGDTDLILCNVGGAVRVYRNIAPHPGHWVGLHLRNPSQGNREPIGAEILVHSGTQTRWSLLQPATSYLASHDPRVLVGLGDLSSVDRVEVLWPEGGREIFPGVPVDQWNEIIKGTGQPSPPQP